ncbi:MAG TPA: alpha/beta hydrolase [Steroidobacteraceae bacterium]|nr:alpha/beta hydrolase [Steroidobacteraceae bacterium]
MATVRKGYVEVPHGEVHFRYAGRGPLVVLLHDSPRSSVLHRATLEWLGEEFTVIALDTPGYGNSTPLPQAAPTIPDFAAALRHTLDALGIGRCAIYGFHSSSKIALQFAADHPSRVALALLDGLSLPSSPAEETFLAHYLQPFEPTTNGEYIARQWSKILDFHRYFPWFALNAANRMAMDLPDDRHLHEYATDVFTAGAGWVSAYGAALRYAAREVIPRLTAPTVFMCREDDVLYGHLDALPDPLPVGSRLLRLPAGGVQWRLRLSELLREALLPPAAWSTPAAASTTASPRHRYVDHLGGQVRFRVQGASGPAPTVLLLHDVPGAARQADELAAALAADRRVLIPDLPGLGESDPLPSPTLGAYVAILHESLEALEPAPVDVIGEGLGTVFALALAANRPHRVRRVVVDGVPMVRKRDRRRFVREYCPRQTPDRAGAYLHRLWDQLRSAHMSWPWFERAGRAARKRDAGLDADALHAALVNVMKQLDRYGDPARAALDAAVRDIGRTVSQPVLVLQDAHDVRYFGTASLLRKLRAGTLAPRPAEVAARAAVARRFLGD